MPITRCDGHLLKEALLGAVAWLTVNREEVDSLNVFPVPDGDTGTNMLLTLQSAVEAIRDLDDPDLSLTAKRAAHGALMGARGNSGVILSQVFRGFATAVADQPAVDARGLAAAFSNGATVAYRAVIKPTEGTMLTVAREAAKAATDRAAQSDDLTETVRAAAEGASAAVERTPTQLKILQDAGVVDAGGFGLQVILEGFLKRMRGEDLERLEKPVTHHALPRTVASPEEGWGYCTEFIINGDDLPVEQVRQEIVRRGQSALVVGDETAIKVHVHTHEPAAVIGYASGVGTLSRLKVDDMSAQHHRLQGDGGKRLNDLKPLAVVAVASGEGIRRILESLGVDGGVPGGQTMNPSTQDLLAAVEAAPAPEVLLLPNNANVILTAQQVPALSRKRVRVVPSRSLPQGIAALLAFDFGAGLEANGAAMAAALDQVRTIEVTRAIRKSEVNGLTIAEGDVIGLLDDQIVAAGRSAPEVVERVLSTMSVEDGQTVTIYAGADAPEEERQAVVAVVERRCPAATVELQSGGQALYPYILAVE
ncbi:MAG TPA: DAK2 domain-containing protein [Candidatus Limnocylindrales bacterium]|nr:DAK2 domain-containing protein [Candidatus Limnocylindrales bacterium]